MAESAGVLRTTSAMSANSTGSGAVINESLEGLVSAVDELKVSLGLGEHVDLSAIEQFINRLRQENEEFRQFAEEAILSAQRLKEERDELQDRLNQTGLEQTMGAALAETQKLKDVADEFEKDLYQQKLAEAAARVAEVEVLKERIADLEEENAGLTQTLNEFRQTTQQLQKLQSHEVRRLQAVEAGVAVDRSNGSKTPPPSVASVASAVAAVEAAGQGAHTGGSRGGAGSGDSSPRATSSGGAATPPRFKPGSRSISSSPKDAKDSARGAAAAPSAEGAAALRVAEQLEEVAGGADSGLLAQAAIALRQLGKRDAALQQQQQENARLKAEVEELNDTMFNKTFKPPSAWAEREIKYKSEKKFWEEQQKELAERVKLLSTEMEAYRGASKTHQLEERIQELEAQLLQTEREKGAARAQLHELQLSTRTAGEFGNAGKKLSPYQGPIGVSVSAGHEVQQMVDHLEHGGVGTESPEMVGAVAAVQRVQGLQAQLHAAATENQHLRRRLQGQQVFSVPASLHEELGQVATATAVMAAAAEIEVKLQRAEAESQALQQLLGGGAVAAGVSGQQDVEPEALAAAAKSIVEQLDSRAQQVEAAGEPGEAAGIWRRALPLQQLREQLGLAEEEQRELEYQVGQLEPVLQQIAAAAEKDGQQIMTVPAVLHKDLGSTAPAATVAAAVAALEERLGEVQQEAADAREQLGLVVHVEQQAQLAAEQQQELEAQLEVRQEGGQDEEVEQLRQQLAAAERKRELAQQQLWQVVELQEQLQKADAKRKELQSQLEQAAGGEGAAELADADQQINLLRAQLQEAAQQPVTLAVQLDAAGGDAAERLTRTEAEADRLRQQLADLQPLRLQLSVADSSGEASPTETAGVGPDAGGSRRSSQHSLPATSPGELLSRIASDASLVYTHEHASALSQERAAADAAWREHQKATMDVPSLLRAKVELETRCQMMEAQLAKMQGELAHVDEANAVMEDHLESAIRTGDVSLLQGMKDKMQAGRNSLSKRMFKRQASKAPSGTKDAQKTADMQSALSSSEEEKNALKRQLAKLSKKYQQVQQQAAHAAGIVAGAQAMQDRGSFDSSGSGEAAANGHDEDGELELLQMREENQMLMEHLVMVKVRQAEMESDYLEAKRQLLRTRERNLQLARRMAELREAAERGDPLPFTPRQGDASNTVTPGATPGKTGGGQDAAPTPKSGRKSLGMLRIPGL